MSLLSARTMHPLPPPNLTANKRGGPSVYGVVPEKFLPPPPREYTLDLRGAIPRYIHCASHVMGSPSRFADFVGVPDVKAPRLRCHCPVHGGTHEYTAAPARTAFRCDGGG